MQYILFIIRVYSAKVRWELGAPGDSGICWGRAWHQSPSHLQPVYVNCSCFVIFFVDLLFEMRNPEGISESSFYTDSYIQKLWSWRL